MPDKTFSTFNKVSSIGKITAADKITIVDQKTGAAIELDRTSSSKISEMLKNDAGVVSGLTVVPDHVFPGIKQPPIIFDPGLIFPNFPFPTNPFPTNPLPTFPQPTFPQPTIPQPAAPQTGSEIDIRIQMIINAIPIADPGNIITSEYHNALREAVRALAGRIGMSVNPVAEFKILSFAPNFLPVQAIAVGATAAPSNKWDVLLNRAAIPAGVNVQLPVTGGFVVQLPDNADIVQLVVRGERLDKDKPKPKEFRVKLNRVRFGKDKFDPVTLINIDLQTLDDGYFEKDQVVKLSSQELNTITVSTQAIIAERKRVNNENYLYYVTAEWLGGANDAAKSEIHSIQIYCTV
ncbi:hypothetical protein BH20ACI4_BH20ACI4_12090 [soil metagenome]